MGVTTSEGQVAIYCCKDPLPLLLSESRRLPVDTTLATIVDDINCLLLLACN